LATLSAKREIRRAVLRQNGILFVRQIAMLAEWSSSEAGRQIANAHVAFNVTGALLVIGFVHVAARVLCRIVPDRPREHEAASPGDLPATRPAE
jgi:Na+/phosphate symporter